MRTSITSASCHETSDAKIPDHLESDNVVALVGSPNSGKTTLFNWLTGSRFKTVNYPGSTVDHSVGSTHERYGEQLTVMDTPGTYSLDPKSPDEEVTMKAIFEHKRFGAARLVIAIADATLLSRHLFVTRQLLDAGFQVILAVTMSDLLTERGEQLDTAALSKELGIPVVLIDGRLGGGVQELVEVIRLGLVHPRPTTKAIRPVAWLEERVETTLRETADLAARVVHPIAKVANLTAAQARLMKTSTARERTRKIDSVLLHPVFGLLIFLGMMTALFSSIFWLAKPIMDAVDKSMSFFADHLLRLAPENLLVQFLSGGVLASASAVLVFVPQIFILFVGIILLEDSGYLARSATLIDKPLSMLGLGGRSFVPLLSGYACAVPAMMAARTINSKRERWLTLFILPLMSCSARLPVYALLLTFLFHGDAAWKAGVMLTGIYVGSLLMGGIAALIAGRFLKITDKSFFMLELPVYRRPQTSLVLRQAFSRTKSYILRAGPAIFAFALIVWVATTFPHYDLENKTERLNQSYAAQAGHLIEPVFRPMGGDWRTGVGLMSAFAAREVFVSSLAVLFQVTDQDEDSMQETLLSKMHDAKAPDGGALFTVSSVIGLILFFMIALQCLSTVTVAVRESGRWRFALTQLILYNVIAYILAVSVVQGLRALGVS
jgi:ferrous iron transport protein B